jgi:glycosyltransferase involved in cell wall biosynthesis
MRVVLVTPWDNAWVPMFEEAVTSRGHVFELSKTPKRADIVIHGWASGASQPVKGAKNVMFLRRYELFDNGLAKVDWRGIDHLICVNSWIAEVVRAVFARKGIKTPVSVVYNAVDTRRWRFKERRPNHLVGMACHVHPKKNIPLALQIMAQLPEECELHIAGDIQDPCTAEYLNHLGKTITRKVYLYGHIDRSQLDSWWEPMGVCLSTSISEGNPNNVLEAMAKGIKPVVHAWPGSEDQFKGLLFDTAAEAAAMITSAAYDSLAYRTKVEKDFSLKNIEKVVDLCLS